MSTHLRVLRAGPIGCSLDEASLRTRAEAFRALSMAALLGAGRTVDGVRVRYRRDPGVAATLSELAHLEAECCSSLVWEVEAIGDELQLIVRGREAAVLDAVLALAAPMVPR